MQSSIGPGIGLSPRSQCATVFGHTPKSLASCDWLNPSLCRICLNLFPVMVAIYHRYRGRCNRKLSDDGINILDGEGTVMAGLTIRHFACAGFACKPGVGNIQHRCGFFGIEEKLGRLSLGVRPLDLLPHHCANLLDEQIKWAWSFRRLVHFHRFIQKTSRTVALQRVISGRPLPDVSPDFALS